MKYVIVHAPTGKYVGMDRESECLMDTIFDAELLDKEALDYKFFQLRSHFEWPSVSPSLGEIFDFVAYEVEMKTGDAVARQKEDI
tara:strand:- start:1414 stop:1668 length:255 start_codon:yes stop_codon:yes gene_type:complete